MARIEKIGKATLYLADCRDVVDSVSAEVVATDPPYGTGRYATDVNDAVVPIIRRFLAGPVAVFGYPERLCEIAIEIGRPPIEWVCWWPSNTNGAARSEKLPRESEHIAFWANSIDTSHIKRERSGHSFARKMAIQRGLDPNFVRDGDVWRDASPGTRDHHLKRHHINEKPVSVMEKIIGCFGADTILDPFMGSGTTGVAAVRLNKGFVGIEIDPEHFDTACYRLDEEMRQGNLFQQTHGQSEDRK